MHFTALRPKPYIYKVWMLEMPSVFSRSLSAKRTAILTAGCTGGATLLLSAEGCNATRTLDVPFLYRRGNPIET